MILVGSGTGTLGRQIVHGPLARGERVRAQRARHSDEQRCPWPAAPRRPGGSVGPGGGDRDLRLPCSDGRHDPDLWRGVDERRRLRAKQGSIIPGS